MKNNRIARARTLRVAVFGFVLVTIAWVLPVSAQSPTTFPTKPIRVVNPHGTGGGTDIIIRMLGERLTETWGQPLVIENRPGANTAIGMEMAAKAPADGYTVAMCTQASHGSNPAVYGKLRYDPLGDFVPIVPLADLTMYLVVRSDSPYKKVSELLAAAKAKPDGLTYGSIGLGSLHHLSAELLKQRTGTKILHVPYKATQDMTVGLLGGQVDMIFHSTPLQLVKSGQVRVLGVTTKQRWPITPEYPTLIEEGVADYEVRGWFALCGRAGTPQAILEKMNRDINAVLREPGIAQRIRDIGNRPMGGTLQEARDLVTKEIAYWHSFVQTSGVKVESP